jgi:hypothetical protein
MFIFTVTVPVYKLTHDQIVNYLSPLSNMVDKICHQFENMDGNPVPDAGISASRISANIMGYDIKGGTNQNPTNISSPQENIDSSNDSNNSTSHLMPSFHSNKLVWSPSTAPKNIFSKNTHNNSHNDNYTDLKVSLGQNPRIKLDTSLGYDLKGGTQLFLLNTSQRDHHCVNFVKNIELTLDNEICTIAKLAQFHSSFGVDFFLLETYLRTLFKLEVIVYSHGEICYISIPLLKNQTLALGGHMKISSLESPSPFPHRGIASKRQITSITMEDGEIPQSATMRGLPAKPSDRVPRTDE